MTLKSFKSKSAKSLLNDSRLSSRCKKKFNFKTDYAKEQLLRAIIINDKHYVTEYVKNDGEVNFEVLNFALEDEQLQILLQPPTRPRPLHLSVLLGRKRITALFLSISDKIDQKYDKFGEKIDFDKTFDSNKSVFKNVDERKYFIAHKNALVNCRDAKLQTPLMLGCVAGHLEIVTFL